MEHQKIEADQTGLFQVRYRVSTGTPGAPELELHLAVATPTRQISGIGQVTQSLEDPLIVSCPVHGEYREYTDINGVNYVISLSGHEKILPVGMPAPSCLEAALVLVGGWDRGTASFSYRTSPYGPMTHIHDATVTKV